MPKARKPNVATPIDGEKMNTHNTPAITGATAYGMIKSVL